MLSSVGMMVSFRSGEPPTSVDETRIELVQVQYIDPLLLSLCCSRVALFSTNAPGNYRRVLNMTRRFSNHAILE